MFGKLTGDATVIGRAVLPAASYFNHSCAPNIRAGQGMRVAVNFATMHDVRAGEELCINYIDLDLPRSSRQHELSTQYFFDCVCARCTEEKDSGHKHITYERSASRAHQKVNHHRSRRPMKK
jgi:SET domain-containing protein